MAAGIKRISTHVLDLARGQPAKGLPVRLERQRPAGNWELLNSDRTDEDGRCGQLLRESDELLPGLYRLAFDTASYFAAEKTETLYPFVEITFQVRSGVSQLHLPLLLNAHGFTTYRGS
jgi:5-hydroxyisourate hydrolase